MSNEATVNSYLLVQKVDPTTGKTLIDYRSNPTSFQADVGATSGPYVGSLVVPTTLVDVDLSQLGGDPGLCRLMNQDPTNVVEYGIRDPATNVFYPLGEILPGESYVLRLSRNIREDYAGTGTSTSAAIKALSMKAANAACRVLVEVFAR